MAMMRTTRDAGGTAQAAEKEVTAAAVAAKETMEREQGAAKATVAIGGAAEAANGTKAEVQEALEAVV